MSQAAPYRWNTSDAAEAYDQAAPAIHPHYTVVQDQILGALDDSVVRGSPDPAPADTSSILVDLGGGSGRFVERFLEQFPAANAVIVDQSEPFLALAERRLARFGDRVRFVQSKLQGDWPHKLPAAPQAIVSMSAIHHLAPDEKRALYARCYEALAPGGVFINGDEYRPESNADYLAMLERWSVHMHAAIESGRIPPSFQQTLDYWYNKNIRNFGTPKNSGDDCHETLATQQQYLAAAGFDSPTACWKNELWAVLGAAKK